jgi:hypothetical protein
MFDTGGGIVSKKPTSFCAVLHTYATENNHFLIENSHETWGMRM